MSDNDIPRSRGPLGTEVRADRDRGKRTAVVAPEQAATPVEAEDFEEENVRRSEPLHPISPAAESEVYAEAGLAIGSHV